MVSKISALISAICVKKRKGTVMRHLVVLAGCAVLLLAPTGCQDADTAVNADKAVKVIVDGNGRFPKSLAGRWKADRGAWEFVFEPDGTFSSAVIEGGLLKVIPSQRVGETTTEKGGKVTYKLGQWTAQYSPDNRELAVEMVLDHFRVDMGSARLGRMEAHGTDWLVGPVSKDSQRWEAQWFSFKRYIVFTPEPNELPFDPNTNPITTIIFRKQQETN
jgi:hypothetical protein